MNNGSFWSNISCTFPMLKLKLSIVLRNGKSSRKFVALSKYNYDLQYYSFRYVEDLRNTKKNVVAGSVQCIGSAISFAVISYTYLCLQYMNIKANKIHRLNFPTGLWLSTLIQNLFT